MRQGVIICDHIFDGESILKAVRDEPIDPVDSGWQFHCNKFDHSQESSAKIISVQELLEIEPSLKTFINATVGTSLEREGPLNAWKVAK